MFPFIREIICYDEDPKRGKMKTKSSKNDLTHEDILRFRKIESVFLSRCKHFGYKEIKTSTVEPLYIFTALGALRDDKLNRIYSFIDWDGWSGERVALKPDSTTCVARYYGDHLRSENPRQKLCYVENHFEWADDWDKISERWQCGVENIGSAGPDSDIEVIYMALDILKNADLKQFWLYLSYPSIIRRMVRGLGLYESRQKELLEAIRRREDVGDMIRKLAVEPEKGRELNAFLQTPDEIPEYSANYLENLKYSLTKDTYDQIAPYLENFICICKSLDNLKCKYVIDFSLLGDLEYYTGIKFQFLSSQVRKSRKEILCSGGRYDSLIKLMWEISEPVPAVGFALFARNMIPSIPATTDKLQNICIYIGNITKGNVEKGQYLCDKLSDLGFSARISFAQVKPEDYDDYGLVIEVDHDSYEDGYQILSSQKIGKPLLMNLFGEFNGL